MQGIGERIAKNCEGGTFDKKGFLLRKTYKRSVSSEAGRGGSVSRRDHNQAYRRRAQLTGGTNKAESAPQTPAALRERGSGGEALLSEKRSLPRRPRNPL